MNNKYTELRDFFSRQYSGTIENGKYDMDLKSALKEILTQVSPDVKGLDVFFATQPDIAEDFNRALRIDGYKTQLDYSQLGEESNIRSIVETNAPCKVVSCVDVLMEFVYCETGLQDYVFKVINNDGCAMKVPILPARSGSTPIIPSGASIGLAAGLADDKCIEVTPDKYGEYVNIDLRTLKCNNCVDILMLKLKQLAQRTATAMHNAIFTKANAIAATVAPSGNLLTTINNMSQTIKSTITTSGPLTYFLAPVVFDALIKSVDGSGRFNIEPTSIECSGKCRTICFQGNMFIEMDRLPIVANTSVILAGYFSQYLAHVVSPVNNTECRDCMDQLNDVLKVGNAFYQEVFIPTDFINAFAKSTITV